jgi:hypothetical protein
MLVSILLLRAFYQVNLPTGDERDHVAVATGDLPLSLSWLWEQHNEHRLPLAKLIWVLSLRLTHYDFRLASLLNVLALGGLCATMVLTAKRIRGRIHYSDAFFPLIVLSPAQYENLLWGWQVGFVTAVVLACALLLLIVSAQPQRAPAASSAPGASSNPAEPLLGAQS